MEKHVVLNQKHVVLSHFEAKNVEVCIVVARRRGAVNTAGTPPARSALAQLRSPTPATQRKNF